jgi:hypothetical protein
LGIEGIKVVVAVKRAVPRPSHVKTGWTVTDPAHYRMQVEGFDGVEEEVLRVVTRP